MKKVAAAHPGENIASPAFPVNFPFRRFVLPSAQTATLLAFFIPFRGITSIVLYYVLWWCIKKICVSYDAK